MNMKGPLKTGMHGTTFHGPFILVNSFIGNYIVEGIYEGVKGHENVGGSCCPFRHKCGRPGIKWLEELLQGSEAAPIGKVDAHFLLKFIEALLVHHGGY